MATDLSWQSLGACRNVKNPDMFYPDNYSKRSPEVQAAKGVCDRCPVKTACRAYALTHRESEGIWGGLTPTERWRVRREEKERLRGFWRRNFPLATANVRR